MAQLLTKLPNESQPLSLSPVPQPEAAGIFSYDERKVHMEPINLKTFFANHHSMAIRGVAYRMGAKAPPSAFEVVGERAAGHSDG